jgi:hypothetical protein
MTDKRVESFGAEVECYVCTCTEKASEQTIAQRVLLIEADACREGRCWKCEIEVSSRPAGAAVVGEEIVAD